MVKNAVKSIEDTTEVVAAQEYGVPAFMREVEMEGRGVSRDQNDILIPMARVLQPLSPEVLDGNPARIEGASAGDILIKNAPQPIVKAKDGFLFQPCHFDTAVVEWKLRSQGGGWVARHDAMPEGVREAPDPQNPDRKIMIGPNGTQMVETRYHTGWLISKDKNRPPMPLAIPFSSSGHSVSRQWMMLMGLKQLGGKPVDSWAIYYEFKTKMMTRNGKSWFVFNISDAGPLVDGVRQEMWVQTKDDFNRGKELFDMMERGLARLDVDAEHGDGLHAAGGAGTAAGPSGDDIPF